MDTPSSTELLARLARESECTDLHACNQVIERATRQQQSAIGAVLDAGLVDETRFLKGLARHMSLPWWEDSITGVESSLRQKFPARLALQHHLLPVRLGDQGLCLLTYDPFNLLARQMVAQAVPEKITWAMGTRRQILQALRDGYGVGAETFDQILEGMDGDTLPHASAQETSVIDEDPSEASVIRFVNQILREALKEHATDIHVEPQHDDLRIRYRIDGVLHQVPVPSQIKLLQASVISRLKIMAHLDIAEKRLPQDGRISLESDGQAIDVRVTTIPSVTGESVSLRLLGQEHFDLARLGLDWDVDQRIRELLAMPNGIVLVTGPTGCGKSTTLYTFLSELNTKERRIVTIEEPVEHQLPGVVQIAVNPEINLTFAACLRSILRGDPNVIMVGEMRDFETAEIAIRAALTGHLVFSTLHTNDAIGGITRLLDMGIEAFLVGSSVRAFLAQRLVRRLCPHCRCSSEHTPEYLEEIGFPANMAHRVLKAAGCEKCRQTGYQGRTAIFEICMVSPHIQDMITRKATAGELRAAAIEEGMLPLRQAGWNKVTGGVTTIEEVVRVTTADVAIQDE